MEVKGVLEGKKEGGRKGREKGLFVVYGGRKEIIDLRSQRSAHVGEKWGLPFQQFHVLFNSPSGVLFTFRSLYLCAIGLLPVFSFRWNLPPN